MFIYQFYVIKDYWKVQNWQASFYYTHPSPKTGIFLTDPIFSEIENWKNPESFRESSTFAERLSLIRVCIRQFAAFFGRNTRRGNIFLGREFN